MRIFIEVRFEKYQKKRIVYASMRTLSEVYKAFLHALYTSDRMFFIVV